MPSLRRSSSRSFWSAAASCGVPPSYRTYLVSNFMCIVHIHTDIHVSTCIQYTTDKSAYRCAIKYNFVSFASVFPDPERRYHLPYAMRLRLWIISSKMNLSPSLGSGIHSGNKTKRKRGEVKRNGRLRRVYHMYMYMYMYRTSLPNLYSILIPAGSMRAAGGGANV